MPTIAELILAQGQNAANARRSRAHVWAPTVQQLANLPNQILADRQAEQDRIAAQRADAQQAEVRELQITQGRRGIAAEDAASARAQEWADLLSTDGVYKPDGTFDTARALATAKAKGYRGFEQEIAKVGQAMSGAQLQQQLTQMQLTKGETDMRQDANQAGVRRMIGESVAGRGGQPLSPAERQTYQGMALQENVALPDALTKEPEPEQEYSIVVKGPGGKPVRKLVKASEMRGGIEEYREPESGPRATYEWSKDPKTGADVYATPDEIRARGLQRTAGISSSVPPEYQNALDRSIMGVPASRRGPIVALANRLASEGNTQELKSVIRQAAIEGENVQAQTQVEARRAGLAALKDVQQTLDELKAAGVSTNILTGKIEDIARQLGTTTDPRLVALKSRIRENLIEYRRAMSGAAFSIPEAQEYEQLSPSYKNVEGLNRQLVTSMISAMESRDRAFWEQKLGPQGAMLVGATQDRRQQTGGAAGRVYYDADGNPRTP